MLNQQDRPDSGLKNNLRAVRTRLKLSQQELATAASITRQTIGGIEAGLYSPSAAVALKLAHALGCRVEDLFWIEEETGEIVAACMSEIPEGVPVRVAMAYVGERWVAHPLYGEAAFRSELVPADGLGVRQPGSSSISARLLDDPAALGRTVAVAGCAPALSLWARSADRWQPGVRVLWTHANSGDALQSLARGEVHIAGLHLTDVETGEHNLPFVRRALPDCTIVLVNLGVWDEGLAVAPGNPKSIQSGIDLARPGMRVVNREEGAGARQTMEALLAEAGDMSVRVLNDAKIAASHQDAARAVASGRADAAATVAAVAAVYGLDFVSVRRVRYDLALRKETLDFEPVRQLLETLRHRWSRSQLELLGGYDTTLTGEIVAQV